MLVSRVSFYCCWLHLTILPLMTTHKLYGRTVTLYRLLKKKTASTGGRRTNTIIAVCVRRDDCKCNYVLDTFFLFHGPFIISSNSLLFLCHVQILHLCSLLFCSWKVTKVNFKENVNDFDEWLDMILYITP